MAFTLAELDAQEDAILAEMLLPVEQHFGDRGMTRRSTDDLLKALVLVRAQKIEVKVTITGVRRRRVTRTSTWSGH